MIYVPHYHESSSLISKILWSFSRHVCVYLNLLLHALCLQTSVWVTVQGSIHFIAPGSEDITQFFVAFRTGPCNFWCGAAEIWSACGQHGKWGSLRVVMCTMLCTGLYIMCNNNMLTIIGKTYKNAIHDLG